MKYLIVAIATLFAAGSVLAQTTAPAEPATKPATKEAAPTKPATAKDVGTKGAALQAEADRTAKRRAAIAKKKASQPGKGDAKPGTKAGSEKLPGPGSLMTADERTAYRTKLKSFKTFDECESFRKTHDAEMLARAKAQGKVVRESTGSGCERYKAAAAKVPDKAAPK